MGKFHLTSITVIHNEVIGLVDESLRVEFILHIALFWHWLPSYSHRQIDGICTWWMGRRNLKLAIVKRVVICGMKSMLRVFTSATVRKSVMDPVLFTIYGLWSPHPLDAGMEKALRKFADGTKLGGLADNIR